MSVEPAQGGPRSLVGDGASDHGPCHGRRNGTVAAQLRRCVGRTQQRFIRHDQVDRDRGRDRRVAAGDPFDQGVGHDLAAGAPVAAGVCRSGQRRIHRHALGDWQQGGQIRHGVRCRPNGDRTVIFGVGRPVDDGLRVQPIGDRPGGRDHPRIAHPLQVAGVAT